MPTLETEIDVSRETTSASERVVAISGIVCSGEPVSKGASKIGGIMCCFEDTVNGAIRTSKVIKKLLFVEEDNTLEIGALAKGNMLSSNRT